MQRWRNFLVHLDFPIVSSLYDGSPIRHQGLSLPAELRIQIYTELSKSMCRPIIVFNPVCKRALLAFRRTAAFNNLLLTCKSVYLDAVEIPLFIHDWALNMHSGGNLRPGPGYRDFPFSALAAVVEIPRLMHIMWALPDDRSVVQELRTLGKLIESRKHSGRDTKIMMNVSHIACQDHRRVVIRGFQCELNGSRCKITLTGVKDHCNDV